MGCASRDDSRRGGRRRRFSACCGASRWAELARELGVTAAPLAHWREEFLAGGQAALKSRRADERDDEIQRLRAKVGEITMNNELPLERRHRLENNLPLPRRRPSE